MSEDKTFNFSAEIDPDYVRQTADEPDYKPKPARITTKRAWFMSLLVPVLSILASAYPLTQGCIILTSILGVICGGILPIVLIVRGRIDTSKFFLGKMILFTALAAVVVTSWITSQDVWKWISEGLHFLILPTVLIIAELVFATTRKTDGKTKLCLVLSSAAWAYLGFTLDFALMWLPLLI